MEIEASISSGETPKQVTKDGKLKGCLEEDKESDWL